MARKKKVDCVDDSVGLDIDSVGTTAPDGTLTDQEALSLELAEAGLSEPILAADESEPQAGESAPDEPLMTDPLWHDFVMSQFTPGELDANKRPVVAGLRRVTQLLLGPIVESGPSVVQVPGYHRNTGELLQPAVVHFHVKLLMCRLEDHSSGLGPNEPYLASYSEVADVYHGNTDSEFHRFATATCATRAESRALRKALRLRTAASEEMTAVPACDSGLSGLVTPTQLRFLDVLGKRLDVDVLAFVNAGKASYDSVRKVPYEKAQEMAETLSGWQTDPSKIVEKLKGYDPNWMAG